MNINEALAPHQAQAADDWAKEGDYPSLHHLISGHVMKGEHTVILPLHDHDGDSLPHPAVEQHLAAHGYKISDYKAGYAVEPKNSRIVRIGKALKHTNAPDHIVNTFINDPSRMVKNEANVEVAITHHPHQIAGMSTGRGWQSCLDLTNGSNRHYIPEEIQNGTHAAYLIHKGDHDIERPIARIALKHFVSKNPSPEQDREIPGHDVNGHHHVLIPENSSYGSGEGGVTTRFEDTVTKWADTHFPMMEDRIYKRSGNTHDDGLGHDITPVSEKMIRSHLDRGINPLHVADPNMLRKHHVEHALDYLRGKESSVAQRDRLRQDVLGAAANAHVTAGMVNREYMFDKANGVLQNDHPSAMRAIMANRHLLNHLSTDNTNELLDHYSKQSGADQFLLSNLVNSPKVTPERREKAVIRPDGYANIGLVNDPEHVTPKIADAVMKAITPAIHMNVPLHALGNISHVIQSKHFTGEHLSKLIGGVNDSSDVHSLMKNPNFGPEHHEKMLSALNDKMRDPKLSRARTTSKVFLSGSKYTTTNDVDKTLEHLDPHEKKKHMKFFLQSAPSKEVLEHAIINTAPHHTTSSGDVFMVNPDTLEHYNNSPMGVHYLATHSRAANIHGHPDLAEKLILHDARTHDIPGSEMSKDEQVMHAGRTAHDAISSAHFDSPTWDHIIGKLQENGMFMRAGTAIKRKYELGHGVNDEHFRKMVAQQPNFHVGY